MFPGAGRETALANRLTRKSEAAPRFNAEYIACEATPLGLLDVLLIYRRILLIYNNRGCVIYFPA